MMTPVCVDTETYPIRPGRQAPRVVCVQLDAGEGPSVHLREKGLDLLEKLLWLPEVLLVGHSIAFDALATSSTRPRLLPLWFAAYAADRVVCTKVREKLVRVAEGTVWRYPTYDLLSCLDRYKVEHCFHEEDKSNRGTRVRYAYLDGVPVAEWPDDARRYAFEDPRAGLALYHKQSEVHPVEWFADQYRQTRADFWLHLISAFGMRVDPRAVEAFARKVEEEHTEIKAELIEAGLVRPNGKRSTKAAAARMLTVCAEKGLPIELTDTGKKKVENGELSEEQAGLQYPSLNADACEGTGDSILVKYARFGSVKTLRSRAERLRIAGGVPIQPRYDVLKETGRTSASMGDTKPGEPQLAYGDQIQNLNREPGLRECYVARPGFYFLSSDWGSAELHTLGQSCLDLGLDSNLVRVLNSGRDAHMSFGAAMRGWTYEWAWESLKKGTNGPEAKAAAKDARQMAKAANFGFPGGLGVAKFRLYAAKTYGLLLSEDQARELRGDWHSFYPEMEDYFAHVNELLELDRPLVHFGSKRYRGAIRYTSAANSYFQGRCADMAKHAGFDLARECYIGSGVLRRARPVAFIHDEFLLEVPQDSAHECALEVVRIMEHAGRYWCPDVPVRAEPALCRRWRKGAEPTYDAAGNLIPWEDRPMKDETRSEIQKALASGRDPIHVSWDFGFEEKRVREAA